MSVKGYGEAECSDCGSYNCEVYYCKECLNEHVKQGKAETFKEVVEWVEANLQYPTRVGILVLKRDKEWQEQKKEWGIIE